VTTKRNIPTDTKTPEQNTGPLPIVITGTLPRDEHSLKLISRLNALSTAGRIEVFYYPEKDNEDELHVLVDPKKSRLVNPARVPEDLAVSDSCSGSTDEVYYEAVDAKLRKDGTPALVLAFPEKIYPFTTEIEIRFSGTWDDSRNNFSRGTLATIPVQFIQTPSFLDHDHTLRRISAANIDTLIGLRGPKTSLNIDNEATLKILEEQLFEASGQKYTGEYLSTVMSHLRRYSPDVTEGISTTGVLSRSGVEYSTATSTSALTKEALVLIDNLLARDPVLAQAVQTAESILAAAQEKAQKIIDDARISETETLERVRELEQETVSRLKELERETIDRAQEQADELTDTAIETARIVPELTDMLRGGPLALISAQAQKTLDTQRSNELRQAQERQLAVKTQLDIIVQSFQAIDSARITSWGAGWGTESYKRNAEQIKTALKIAKNDRGFGLPRFEQIEKLIDTTNLGHAPMTLEDATLAIGLHSFVRETRKLDAYIKLAQWTDSDKWSPYGLESWDIDQVQMDRAFLESMLAHCEKGGFSEGDRKFLETCDHILAGEISQSLRRSLDTHLMERSMDEITSNDPFSQSTDTAGLLDEVEHISRQKSLETSSGHQPGSLRATMEEINIAASRATGEPAGQANRPTLAPGIEPAMQQSAMRSDGTVVQFPQR